jgi:Protein of unknown function DUF262
MLTGDLRIDFENYIREAGRPSQGLKPKPRLALRDRDREFFSKYVQELRFDDLFALDQAGLDDEAKPNIQANSRLIHDRLQSTFGNDADLLGSFGSFLIQRCYLVAVSTPTQQSAFRVFSVLNNRGLDLLPTDIVKADVIGRIPHGDPEDKFSEKWEELEVQPGRTGFNDFFGYIRMICAKTKAKRALLEEFREHVWPKSSRSPILSPEDLIEKVLEPYAEAYLIAKTQQYVSTKNAEDVNHLLKWLSRIDHSD